MKPDRRRRLVLRRGEQPVHIDRVKVLQGAAKVAADVNLAALGTADSLG